MRFWFMIHDINSCNSAAKKSQQEPISSTQQQEHPPEISLLLSQQLSALVEKHFKLMHPSVMETSTRCKRRISGIAVHAARHGITHTIPCYQHPIHQFAMVDRAA